MEKSRSSRRRVKSRAMLAIASLVFLTSCSSTNNILVDGAARDPNHAGAFTSQLDNPVLRGKVELRPAPAKDQSLSPLEEAFATVGSKWTYSYFDLTVKKEKGDANKGAPTDIQLYTEPETIGEWGAAAGQNHWYPWQVRGAQVGYTPILFSVFKERDDHSLTLSALPASAVLDPHVMLVPLQVVRVVPKNQTSSHYKWITQAADERTVRNWLDQTRSIVGQGVSHPGGILAQRNYADQTPPPFGWKRPDEIWAQAQIQWRLISIKDLAVEDQEHYLPSSCQNSLNTSIWNGNYNDAVQQGLIRSDLPTLFIAIRPAGSDCIVHGYGKADPPYAVLGVEKFTPLVASHELGHTLNLGHPCSDGDRLMCEQTIGPTIGPTTRLTARKQAAIYVKKYWGVDVLP
jgi:hypothetical protein